MMEEIKELMDGDRVESLLNLKYTKEDLRKEIASYVRRVLAQGKIVLVCYKFLEVYNTKQLTEMLSEIKGLHGNNNQRPSLISFDDDGLSASKDTNSELSIIRQHLVKPKIYEYGREDFKRFKREIEQYLRGYAISKKVRVIMLQCCLAGIAGDWADHQLACGESCGIEVDFDELLDEMRLRLGGVENRETLLTKLADLKMDNDFEKYEVKFFKLVGGSLFTDEELFYYFHKGLNNIWLKQLFESMTRTGRKLSKR
jgi:hypothetical protein